MDKDINWEIIDGEIRKLLGDLEMQLRKEDSEEVFHYLNYDEYEIAFELLFLCMMELPNIPNFDYCRFKEIGLTLKLNEETKYDPDFWKNFVRFVS